MITREQLVTQSVQDFLRAGFIALDYGATVVEVRDAFPTEEMDSQLTRNQVAVGYQFDDGGRPIECGSTFVRMVHTVEFFTFALTAEAGENVATVIRQILRSDSDRIPLKNYAAVGAPVIDYLLLDYTTPIKVERMVAADPRPWEEHLWMTRARVADEYDPAA